jgi:hypothetical protein
MLVEPKKILLFTILLINNSIILNKTIVYEKKVATL